MLPSRGGSGGMGHGKAACTLLICLMFRHVMLGSKTGDGVGSWMLLLLATCSRN